MKKLFAGEKTLGVLAVVLALAVWQCGAWLLNSSFILPSPVNVFIRLFTIWKEDNFIGAVMFSFVRIIGGFLLGTCIGFVLAVIAGRFSIAEILLKPYMTTIKSVPVASFVIVALLIFSSSNLSVFISFLMALPVVYTNILSGIKSSDPELLEMSRLFNIPWTRRFVYIIFPQLKPYILSASSVAAGLAWKSGIAAEVIGIPAGSVGEMLYYTKLYYEMTDLFAWTVIIVALSVAFEKLFCLFIKLAFRVLESKK